MKKTYLVPTMQVVPVQLTQMICSSVKSNVEFVFDDEGTPSGFSSDDIR